jgi:hypothetical protein
MSCLQRIDLPNVCLDDPDTCHSQRLYSSRVSTLLGEDPRNTLKEINTPPKINISAPRTEAQFGCGRMKLEKSGA